MAEEPGGQQEGQDPLAPRLERLEREVLRENRWWRGGLIAALVFLALSILIAGHRHHHRHRPPPPPVAMGSLGWQGGPIMPYGQFHSYGPPPWGFACGGPSGCGCYGRPGFHHFRPWNVPGGPAQMAPGAPQAPRG